MLVFRYEHGTTGNGPYDNGFGLNFGHSRITGHPGAWDIPKFYNIMSDNVIFGFPNIEKLKWWFKGHHKKLFAEGFIIAVYDVPDSENVIFGISGKQLVFRKNSAFLVEKLYNLPRKRYL